MWGIRRLRFAIGVDDDLRPFHDRFRDDPLIGRAVRAHPHLRVRRRPRSVGGAARRDHRAADRVRARGRDPAPAHPRLGRRCPRPGCATCPRPPRVAGRRPRGSPRSTSPRPGPSRCAARPRRSRPAADLLAADPLPGWRAPARDPRRRPLDARDARLHGHGHHDRVPAGDLGFLKLVGRARDGQPAGARRGPRGARVLRALRRLARARRRVPARRGAPAAGSRQSCSTGRRVQPLPGRNSFVSTRSAFCGCLISPLSRIQSA